MGVRVSEVTQGRDNNFNLVRIVAAFAVLVGHSYPLSRGNGATDPVGAIVGLGLGSIAVDVFFVTSGFLVTSSLLARERILEFFWARALRIYPALAVMVMLTVFGLGLHFTNLSAATFLADARTLDYLVKNIILFRDVVWNLPGVFESNPFRNAVNGSLWTLPKEVKLYTLLAVVWFLAGIVPSRRLTSFKIAVVSFAIVGAIVVAVRRLHFGLDSVNWHLFFMFFIGSALYVVRDWVFLSRGVFSLMVAAILFACFNAKVFFAVYILTLAYMVLYLAYVPAGCIRQFNRAGDYSYGVYIYAFPVQQMVAATIPGVSLMVLMAIASAGTLLLATLSWHLIEKRALSMRGRCVEWSDRLLARSVASLRGVLSRKA